MLKVVVAFPINDASGYKVEYINGENLTIHTEGEYHDLIVTEGRGSVVGIFANWIWAKVSSE